MARTVHRIFLVEHFMWMDWNLRNPLQWDWENFALLSAKEGEISKSAEQLEWKVEGGLISNGSVYSSGSGTCTGSELCNVSSKNSISASAGSSSKVGNKISEVNFEAVEDFSENQNKNNEMAWEKGPKTSPMTVGFIGAGEPPIGLKLGKRTYFENLTSTNIKTSTSSASIMPPTASVKRSKACHQGNQHSCCQVEGCNIDLTVSKDYHRKHRVCERHSKSPRVLVSGFERRFCQQCSRFHDLSEFDQKKRSCRRRLSDHNARRRKPQPKTLSFNHSRLSSAFYDERQQMNIFLNLAPFNHVRPSTSSLWDDPHVFRLSMTKGSWNKPTKAGIDGQLCVPMMDFSTTATGTPDDFSRLAPFKCTTTEVLSRGLEASSSCSNLNGAPDLQCALSLLSSDAWIPSSTVQSNMIQLPSTYPTASHPSVQANLANECWQHENSLTEQVLTFNLYGNGSHLHEFHLSKAPYGSPLFEANQIFPKSDGHFLEFKT